MWLNYSFLYKLFTRSGWPIEINCLYLKKLLQFFSHFKWSLYKLCTKIVNNSCKLGRKMRLIRNYWAECMSEKKNMANTVLCMWKFQANLRRSIVLYYTSISYGITRFSNSSLLYQFCRDENSVFFNQFCKLITQDEHKQKFTRFYFCGWKRISFPLLTYFLYEW